MSGLFDQVVNYSPPLLTTGQVNYKGTWNASTNSPTLVTPPAVTSKGDYYVVSAAGTQFTISFAVGDWIISNGAAWEKVDLTDAVSSVHGRTGAVVGVSTDYSAVGITNTAIGASSPSTGAFTTLSAASLTSPAASNLTLGTGSAGTALTFTSATGAATFAAPVTTSAGFVSNTTSAAALINTPTSTSQRFLQLANSTNGNIYVGVESSVAGAFFTGSTAYEPVIYTPAASLFLRTSSGTVRTNGNFKVEGTTASTSTTTGALIVSGGAGFAGNVHSGGTGNFSGVITSLGGNAGVQIYDRTNGVSDAWLMSAINGPSSVLSFVNNGNSELTVGKGGTVTARGALTAASGTMATSFGGITTGLTLNNASTNATAGRGVQIDFTGTSGGTLARIIGQTTTTANTTGSLTFQTASAGVYGTRMTIAANGDTSILSTTASTSTTTGSLVNSGGFGNAGAAYFGGLVSASHSLTVIGGAAIGVAAFQASGNQASQLIANLTSSISGAGTSFGLRVAAGTNASDYAFRVLNQAGSSTHLEVRGDGLVSAGNGLAVTGTLSSTGALSIGNTVNTVSPTSPNRTVTIVINGTTYYLAAKTTND